MHSVMNGIVSSDGEYQAILRKSDIYSGELNRMDLSKEIRLLIDRYVSEQNAHSTCAIDPGLGCSPTCLAFPTAKTMFLGKCLPTEAMEQGNQTERDVFMFDSLLSFGKRYKTHRNEKKCML